MSDLSGSKLDPILQLLVVGVFNAKWKSGDDPNDFGQPFVGPESAYRFEHIEEKLDWVSCSFISHMSLQSQEWAKSDLHPIMKVYMKSGTNVLIFAFIVCISHVMIV